jgi:hypothetical protein
MAQSLVPRGNDWADVVEVLRSVTNLVTVRSHYEEGHPAIQRADEHAAGRFAALLARLPEIVLALVDGEFVVCERPLPDLRARLPVLAESMIRHDVECIVFQRGIHAAECTQLGRILAAPTADPGRAREQAQATLVHVLFRYAELQSQQEGKRGGGGAEDFVPAVFELLQTVGRAVASGTHVDRNAVRGVAKEIVACCARRAFALVPRCHTPGVDDLAPHSVNVAMMTAAMALDAQMPDRTVVDATAAALLHDIGFLFLPAHVRGIPEPLLDDAGKAIFRHHCFVGASALLGAGCPPLWVAAALEHHRGVDGRGYPALESKDPPHELVRFIALATFHDRKRTLVGGQASDPEDALRQAIALRDRYFGRAPLLRFVRALGIHPPGTIVELSDRQAAMVVEASATEPARPVVRLVTGDNAGKRIDLKTLDALDDRYALSIVRAIAPPIIAYEAPTSSPSEAPGGLDVEIPQAAIETIAARQPASEPPPREPAAPPPEPQVFEPRPSAIPASTAPMRRLSGMYSSLRIRAVEAPRPSSTPPSRPPPPPSRPAPFTSSSGPPPADPPSPEVIERSYLTRIGSLDGVPVVLLGPAELATLTLDHRAGFMLTFVDGATTLDDVLDACGLPRAEGLQIVADLLKRKVIAMR